MEEVIGRILEIDSLEQELIHNAESVKINIEQTAQKRKQDVKDQYLEHAKKRIEILREAEKANAEETLEQQAAINAAAIERMNHEAAENADIWADELFKRVITRLED